MVISAVEARVPRAAIPVDQRRRTSRRPLSEGVPPPKKTDEDHAALPSRPPVVVELGAQSTLPSRLIDPIPEMAVD